MLLYFQLNIGDYDHHFLVQKRGENYVRISVYTYLYVFVFLCQLVLDNERMWGKRTL